MFCSQLKKKYSTQKLSQKTKPQCSMLNAQSWSSSKAELLLAITLMISSCTLNGSLYGRFTCRLRARWQDFVLLRVDNSGTPHQWGYEGGDDGGVHPRDGNVCGKRRLLDGLALHSQPEVVHEHLVRDRNLRPGELQAQHNVCKRSWQLCDLSGSRMETNWISNLDVL